MTERSEARSRSGRDEVQAWYLIRLRPRLAEAVTAGRVGRDSAAELDRQVRQLLELPANSAIAVPWAA